MSEIECQLVKVPLAAASYQFIFLTHPTNPCMKYRMKLEIDYHTGNYMPYSFR